MLKVVLFAILRKLLIYFYIKYRECKACNTKRVSKRYYKIKNEILQQRREKNACFKDLVNRLKALEEKLGVTYTLT